VNPLRKVVAMLRSSPPKRERRAAIATARAERKRSAAGAASARKIAGELREATTNHYADDIVQRILHGYGNGG
jgi:hypothetical protein